MLHTIESNKPFNVVFIEFWEPWDIQDHDISRNIITCMGCMTGFGRESSSGLKEITSDHIALWDFENFFVPFGIRKIIVVDAGGMFSENFKNIFQ